MSAKEIILGVTGSIGAYKAADLVRRLRDEGLGVTCLMTKEACCFLAPLTLQTLSERKAYTDLFSLEDPHVVHTELAEQADLLLIAPATANMIGKLSLGLADDLVTCVVLATTAPVLIAPAMNVHMYQHPTVQDNIKRLKALGYHFVGPDVGNLACGYEAIGHLAEVEEIVRVALRLLAGPARLPAPRQPSGQAGVLTDKAPAHRAHSRARPPTGLPRRQEGAD